MHLGDFAFGVEMIFYQVKFCDNRLDVSFHVGFIPHGIGIAPAIEASLPAERDVKVQGNIVWRTLVGFNDLLYKSGNLQVPLEIIGGRVTRVAGHRLIVFAD